MLLFQRKTNCSSAGATRDTASHFFAIFLPPALFGSSTGPVGVGALVAEERVVEGRGGPLPPRAHPKGGKVMLMQSGDTSETRPISVAHSTNSSVRPVQIVLFIPPMQ